MYEYNVKLERVIDGDTVDVTIDLGFNVFLYNQRVRLFGIDTPELRSSVLEERNNAKAAKDRLIELLPEHFVIQSQKYDDRGKYGRILAILMVDKESEMININEQLILEGYAERYE